MMYSGSPEIRNCKYNLRITFRVSLCITINFILRTAVTNKSFTPNKNFPREPIKFGEFFLPPISKSRIKKVQESVLSPVYYQVCCSTACRGAVARPGFWQPGRESQWPPPKNVMDCKQQQNFTEFIFIFLNNFTFLDYVK